MPRELLHSFQVSHLSILTEDGSYDEALEPDLTPAQLKKMFQIMLLTREFDQRCTNLQRQGRSGTYAASTGQEAIAIGSAAAMDTQDWAVPSFREQGVYFYRGVPLKNLFLFFMGSEEGNRIDRKFRTLPYCVPCASQILHGVGIAMAAKYKNESSVAVVYFGEGASSEGDFHEGLNFASTLQCPTVFICQNNQWAISTPSSRQTHSATIAQKAIAYGMPGLQVDGNDVLAVYAATKEAIDRARRGDGPTLLECMTYRLVAHTTADDPTRYRSDDEVALWQTKDPLLRFEKYLLNKKILLPDEKEEIQRQNKEQLKTESEAAEKFCKEISSASMFEHLYQNPSESFLEYCENAKKILSNLGKD